MTGERTTGESTARGDMPSEIELLLPWYAAGTLDVAEARQVEAALAADPELAARYEWVRAEFAQETAIGDAAGDPGADDAAALFARIDALPAAARRPRGARRAAAGLGDRIAEFIASLSPRTLAWSAAVPALAIVLQAGLLADIFTREHIGGYQTASAPTNAPGQGAYVLIRFKAQATAADITSFLAANKLAIVGGPSGGTLFRVEVAPKKLAAADLARVVATLQNDKVVGFIAATE